MAPVRDCVCVCVCKCCMTFSSCHGRIVLCKWKARWLSWPGRRWEGKRLCVLLHQTVEEKSIFAAWGQDTRTRVHLTGAPGESLGSCSRGLNVVQQQTSIFWNNRGLLSGNSPYNIRSSMSIYFRLEILQMIRLKSSNLNSFRSIGIWPDQSASFEDKEVGFCSD